MSASEEFKKIWERVNGPIPKGYHLHRITPGYLGGEYTLDNVDCLSPYEHAIVHKLLWEEHGDRRDYTAFRILSGISSDTFFERCSLGGHMSGAFKDVEAQRARGQKGGKSGIGDHIDKEAYAESRKAGGAASAERRTRLGLPAFSEEAIRKSHQSRCAKFVPYCIPCGWCKEFTEVPYKNRNKKFCSVSCAQLNRFRQPDQN